MSARWNFRLPIVVGDSFPEKTAAMRGAQGLESISIQTRPSDAREDGIEKIARKPPGVGGRHRDLRGGMYRFAGHRILIIVANLGKVKGEGLTPQ